MEILTREIIGFAEVVNTATNDSRTIGLNLARGNAAIINEIAVVVEPRLLQPLTDGASREGRVAVALDANLLAPADIPGRSTQDDDDVGQGRGLLDMFGWAFHLSAQQDTTNNNASAAFTGGGPIGMAVDYRELNSDNRPMTTENPELIIVLTGAQTININATLRLYYQIVRLTERELGRLSGDVRPTVLRVASVPESGAAIRKEHW